MKKLGFLAVLCLLPTFAWADVSWTVSSSQAPSSPGPTDTVTQKLTITLDSDSDPVECSSFAKNSFGYVQQPGTSDYNWAPGSNYASRFSACLAGDSDGDGTFEANDSMTIDLAKMEPKNNNAAKRTHSVGIYARTQSGLSSLDGSFTVAALSRTDFGHTDEPVVCDPTVTWGDGGDYANDGNYTMLSMDNAFEDAKSQVAAGETATVGFMPTDDGTNTYELVGPKEDMFTNWTDKNLIVCGNGAKITLRPDNAASGGFMPIGTNYADKLTLRNLRLENAQFSDPYYSMTVQNVHYERLQRDGDECIGPRNDSASELQNPDYTAISGYKQANPDHETFRLELLDSTFVGCGGEGDHAVYWAVRGCTAIIDNVRIEHIGSREGIRSLCHVTTIKNSWQQNYIGPDGSNPEDGKTGVAAFDVPSAGLLIYKDNICNIGQGSNMSCIATRSRRSLFATDIPGPCEPVGDDYDDIPQCSNVPNSKWMDDTFWQNVNATPINENNDYIFPKFFSGNKFVGHTNTWNNYRVPVRVGNTSARRTLTAYSTDAQYVIHHPNWVERTVSFYYNNTCEGSWDACANDPQDRTDLNPINADSYFWDDAEWDVEEFVNSTTEPPLYILDSEPSWWPSSDSFAENCKAWNHLYWPDETPAGEAYPTCPEVTSTLSQAADATAVGEMRELETVGWYDAPFDASDAVVSGTETTMVEENAIHWTNPGQWCASCGDAGYVFIRAQAHGRLDDDPSTDRLRWYDVATNTWEFVTTPVSGGHGYNHTAIDEAGKRLISGRYASSTYGWNVDVWDISGATPVHLGTFGKNVGNNGAVSPMAVHPNQGANGRLWMLHATGGKHELWYIDLPATGVPTQSDWVEFTAYSTEIASRGDPGADAGRDGVLLYHPQRDTILVGGDGDGTYTYEIAQDGTLTRYDDFDPSLASSPGACATISVPGGTPMDGGQIIPVPGESTWEYWCGSQRYGFDPAASSGTQWTHIAARPMPPYGSGADVTDDAQSIVATAIPELGVTLAAAFNDGDPAIYTFRH